MKKILVFLVMLLSFGLVACDKPEEPNGDTQNSGENTQEPSGDTQNPDDSKPEEKSANLGFVTGKIGDFTQYENTSAYVQVTTAEELLDAIEKARYSYTSTWKFDPRNAEETAIINELNELEEKRSAGTITTAEKTRRLELENQTVTLKIPGHVEQDLKAEGTVHVIEIMNDLEMGYKMIDETKLNSSYIEDFSRKGSAITACTHSDIYNVYGVSQIKIENTSNLMIYSKNGAKLTHCGIKMNSCTNVVIRNLAFDEIWQWEDSASTNPNIKIGDYDGFGWAYFKIGFCGYVWIDHCSFGKAYDGLIDVSNAAYDATKQVAFRAPYGADGGAGVHISNCNFKSGSADKDGYIYKMMAAIEEDYQNNGGKYLYYKTLRDLGATFDEILNAVAIPQKKGFLLGDSGDPYEYNLKIKVSFDRCYFKNVQDRLPKIRGGIAYMSNSVIDSLEFMNARKLLKDKGIDNDKIITMNLKYKLALVSQGVVCGLGGEFMAENCKYLGVESLLKNNDSNPSNFYYGIPSGTTAAKLQDGTYNFNNVLYKANANEVDYTDSTDRVNVFDTYNSTPTDLTQVLTASFDWRNETKTKPFTHKLIHQNLLIKDLLEDNPVGTITGATVNYTYCF